MRKTRRLFSIGVPQTGQPLLQQTQAYFSAATLVRAFYAAQLYLTLRPDWGRWHTVAVIEPLWPLAWLRYVPVSSGIAAIMMFAVAGAASALAFPRSAACRTLAALSFLQFAALPNSFGKIGHGTHAWLWVAAVLVFLPQGECDSRARRQRFLTVFWIAQALVLLFYSMSGAAKLLLGARQVWLGEISAFHPQGMSLMLAQQMLNESSRPPLAAWLMGHSYAGWAMHVGAIFLESGAVLIAFRPSWHRAWGLGLIGMHVGVMLALGVVFREQCLLLGLLLVASPLVPSKLPARAGCASGLMPGGRQPRPGP